MSSIPSVVCAVDLSHRAAKVLQHAGALAEHFRARLTAVTVEPDRASAARVLSSLRRDVLERPDDSSPAPHIRVATGQPAETILRLAHEEGADLLVIGTHGTGGVRGHAFGSTTREILRAATLPVLVVPNSVADLRSLDDPQELSRLGSVLAPIDFSPLSRRDARIAARIAEVLDVPLLLVHASPDTPQAPGLEPEAARAQLAELRREILGATPIETRVMPSEPASVIAAVVSERHVGLVVMGLRGAGGADGPRPGSIAYRVLCAAPTLLLALPPVLRAKAAPSARAAAYART
jgi:nucleotide-binding universal stress UspA family protein